MFFKKKKVKIQWFDDYIKEMISEFTGFETKKIIPNVAYKSNHKIFNEFDCFDFIYRGKVYRIEKGKHIDEKYI